MSSCIETRWLFFYALRFPNKIKIESSETSPWYSEYVYQFAVIRVLQLVTQYLGSNRKHIVTYLGSAWLIRRVLVIWWLNLYWTFTQLAPTVHKSLSDSLIFFRLDTPRELFWLPTELNSTTPLYSHILLQFSWLFPLLITRHGFHGKHHPLLSRMSVYWSVT
jgi:hypothetical protein